MLRRMTTVAAVLVFSAAAGAQDVLPPKDDAKPQRGRAGQTLRNTARPGPWDNDVLLFRCEPGKKPERVATFERAGVPNIVRDGKGRLVAAFQWFPDDKLTAFDRIAVRFSLDEGKTWSEPAPVVITGVPADVKRQFDPTLAPLDDGRIRLYFSSHKPSHTPNAQSAIYSAVSSDGVHYEFEPGARFSPDGRSVIDCAVVRLGDAFHLFAPFDGPADGKGFHAVSRNGLDFERSDDVAVEGPKRWLGCAVAEEGGIRFYGTNGGAGPTAPAAPVAESGKPEPASPPATPQPGGGVWTAFSRDGQSWALGETILVGGADPGVVTLADGARLVIVTGPPRPGTPSSRAAPPHRTPASH